ncbi:unnamed protein product [Oikopleura dioica]|uniref:Uncharacterized protein n=1 Tax=Oikopleura dioica TaxID=34765 RepID=E4YRX3_OIKDI|nr:unnamed protein product [Oikopleura dioica]
MPESARINCDSQDKSDDETAQLPSKTVKTNHSTLLFTKSSSPKERLKEKQNDYRGLADEADIESDDCKKKIFLRSFVKERPDPIAHNEPSSFEKDEIIVEGTTDDPTDPNCEWITLKLDPVAPEENDTLSAVCKRTPERKKRDFKSERDISINCTRPKRRRLITDKKNVLAVAQVKREIDPKHRNFIERGHAWQEIQDEEVRPLPTFYTSERRLNNSRLGRIMGDQQDELFFANKQI